MILFNFPVKVWTHIHCLKNQIHTRLATVHRIHTPPGQVNREPPRQTLRQKFEKTDGPYIVPWRSMDAGSARPLGEVNSWAEDVSQRKQSLHSPDVQIQGVSAKTLWLVSAVKIELRGGEEEIPWAAAVQATPFHWSKLVVSDSHHQNRHRNRCLETNTVCKDCVFHKEPLSR